MPLSARLRPLLLLLGAATSLRAAGEPYDIVVYGDSAAAVAAAVQAKRQGSKVLLVNTTKFLGGMTCSGLSASDIFHREAVGVVLKDTIRA
jgi:predicted flavoprotein YhiN